MSEFHRDDRYLVLKKTDILKLSSENLNKLQDICAKVSVIRAEREKGEINCVVIEDDWPEYEVAWSLIETRVKGGDRNDTPLKSAARLLQGVCHGASHSAGWWQHGPTGLDLREIVRNPIGPLQQLLAGALVAQKLCLTHSEISEAMEGHRKNLPDDKLPHRPMTEVELADAIIRAFDLAGALGYDLGSAIQEKMAFNAQREDHKPEARAAMGGKAY